MEAFDLLGAGLLNALEPHNFLILVGGMLVGTVAGALPGISFVNAMAMSLPFTYLMAPATAMAFLGGIYVGGVFGGSISSILINIPGTPASLPACWEGYPLTKRGLSRRALHVALTSSAIGGMASALLLTFASPPFASFALTFDQPEFFAATVLGLLSVVAIAKESPVITLLSLFLGMLIGTVGVDPMFGMPRFSFGLADVQSGINFVVVMIGLFAVGEVVDLMASKQSLKPSTDGQGGHFSWRELPLIRGAVARATSLGCIIGMIPGAGATVAAVIAYGIEKQASARGSRFGTGMEEGLAAPEAAKNATTGAAMIPLLTLGIPGSAATAIMLAALMLHGIAPGPLLFATDTTLVYTVFASMLLANLLMIAAAILVARGFSTLMKTPTAILGAFIVVLSLLGAYGVRNNFFDVWVCVAFGIIGYVMKRTGFPSAPLVLGVILGPLAERYFLTSLANYEDNVLIFIERPISGTIMALAVLFVLWSLWPVLRPLFPGRSHAAPHAAPHGPAAGSEAGRHAETNPGR
ncbi:tripartite tricarboxylate transporter permease [Azospirillum sp. ST 5-10]|uniref:tripartite tricarboxylate transporter permease n=1 Tax=unclassified Azospirillum TaxID=2630922 RepID=UPI003F49DDDC